nr:immunoglobulin heavy chain junction region [Mus musculus]
CARGGLWLRVDYW